VLVADIRLDPMTDEEFSVYYQDAVADYATGHVGAGSWPAEGAQERAAKDYGALLPDGRSTAGHRLLTARDGSRRVGMVWFAERTEGGGRVAYVYDIRTEPLVRGDGYGEAIMRAVESRVVADGFDSVRLRVFGNNSAARSLYRKLGYTETNVTMVKRFG
jgi:ribosomal protein S18 acetylase RimI-like enzyme